MIDFIRNAYSQLSEDDKNFLSVIYTPKEVAVPDDDPGFGQLTVCRNGAIRFYGHFGKRSVFDTEAPRCYIESRDSGLSWKRYMVNSKSALGASTYIPFLDIYLSIRFSPDEGTFALVGSSPDDSDPKKYPIPGEDLVETAQILPMRSKNRVIITCMEKRPTEHPTAYYQVILITEDCKNFRCIRLPAVPYAELRWPHKGLRWQQNNREATVAELSDGSLMLLSRTSTDFLYTCRSFDGGESWTVQTPSIFHSTGTMPRLLTLSDGRLMLFWCNTNPLPELKGADGIWEDYFTNRDANHTAISEDNGKTWLGFREMMLNPLRTSPDFRSAGGPEETRDKSVHQFEALELPMGKVLIACGQHRVCRRIMILDPRWLYETTRREDFIHGFAGISSQGYIKSIAGGYRASGPENAIEYSGHCAYNRVSSALLIESPENNGKEALFIRRINDPVLISGVGGATWNFPASRKGELRLRAYLPGQGLRVSLLDHWRNPCDSSVTHIADASIVISRDMQPDGEMFTEFILKFDCDSEMFTLTSGNYLHIERRLNGEHPMGLSYLHLQSAATAEDLDGSYISGFSFTQI